MYVCMYAHVFCEVVSVLLLPPIFRNDFDFNHFTNPLLRNDAVSHSIPPPFPSPTLLFLSNLGWLDLYCSSLVEDMEDVDSFLNSLL